MTGTGRLLAMTGGVGVGAGVAYWLKARRGLRKTESFTCEDVMTAQVAVVGTGQPVSDAARMMRDLNVGFVPVCQSDQVVLGTITDRDIAVRYVAENLHPSTTVQDIMSPNLVCCHPSDDLERAAALMREHQVNRVLVVDDRRRVVGVISLADLTQFEDERQVGKLTREISRREV
jgi:CBS domain-containing protein